MISRRDQFTITHPSMSHASFLTIVQVPKQLAAWVIAVREAMGHFLQLPSSVIYPTEKWQALEPFFSMDGWDDIGFIISLEECGVEFLDEASQLLPRFVEGRFFWLRWQGAANIGEWSVRAATHLISSNCRLASSNNDISNA